MMNGRKISLRTRIWLTRLEYAVTRFESAVTIALLIVALPTVCLLSGNHMLPQGAWVAVVVIGAAAEGALIVSSMSDPAAGASEVGVMLRSYFGVPEIEDDAIRQQVARAIEYRGRMEDVLGGTGRALRRTMSDTLDAVDRWITGIGRLAKRLDRLCDAAQFQAAGKCQLRERINDLENRARAAHDSKIQQRLRETIAGSKHQLRMIEQLENVMEVGDLRLEHGVGALGTIYAQLTIFAVRGMDGGDASRLDGEIADEIDQVDAVLGAMDRIWDPASIKETATKYAPPAADGRTSPWNSIQNA